MSRGCLLKVAALLACAHAYEGWYLGPESKPVGIADEENAATAVTGELGHPLHVHCLASEKPIFFVLWYRGNQRTKWLNNDSLYGTPGNNLLIRSLAIETLGQYTCQAYSSEGMEVPRVINVRAYMPEGLFIRNEWLVLRDAMTSKPDTTSVNTLATTKSFGETDKLELDLAASEGDKITLRCLLDSTLLPGDPLHKVTWKFGGLTINGSAGRFRLMPDGALDIVPLYRNDTGVYSCVANNRLRVAKQKIHLVVNGPVRIPAGIVGEDNAKVTGELYQSFHVRCLAYGYPYPSVFWTRGYGEGIVLYNDSIYDVTENVLTIRSLSVDTLGPYTCQAYNGAGRVASWGVVVQAYRPEGLIIENEWLVPRDTMAPRPTTQPSITTDNWLVTEASIKPELTRISKETTTGSSDISTTNEETNDVTRPSTLDPCSGFQFGCCADNKTEPSGPYGQGCARNTTEFSCCPDRVSPESSITSEFTEITKETAASFDTSEGNTNIEETCSGYQFGCCADNETEASGPDGQGCPCNTTEFGCCPDGVLLASGLNNEGCPTSCSTTLYGCCQDGKTPAHGPEFEGCCLLQDYGCCPDNSKPDEGPHLEGCGCQYALHGCCPDDVTSAQGPDNLGCGCQYTQHGCCPDRHTAAFGPNNEGCACYTYQFGCCADGVTVAPGPDQQGCHCRDSKFGCCGDGETPATGPDAAGCDCSSSRHGCCPDGRTEAIGPKFLGCTDAPENKQAACSMSPDPGHCHNFTAMWYYDVAYGGCSRFWYGGCEGNDNRFSTKEDCKDVCVQPSPKDTCKLLSVKGACDGNHTRWHYNSIREQCMPFRYGGCLGNANNFDTRELCQKQCEPSSVAGQCDLPIDQGSCAGNYSRWGFNPEAHRCEQFIWGGCEGNSNRFSSEAACQMRCADKQPPRCTQPQEAGNCGKKEALWSFSQSENRCLPFYYSGCGGNDNRFGSRKACEQTCPSAYVPDKCTLPAETGQCSNYRERWFYDTTFQRCRQFYYGGCAGNENNFATEAECDNSCLEIKTTNTTTTTSTTTTRTTARPAERLPQPQHPDTSISPESERSDVCKQLLDPGPCQEYVAKVYFDQSTGQCLEFVYGGCLGGANRFSSIQECSQACKIEIDLCSLPPEQGNCNSHVKQWYYDSSWDRCYQFTYTGCDGNDNRFETQRDCEARCKRPESTTTTVAPPPQQLAKPECQTPSSLVPCGNNVTVFYYDSERGQCFASDFGGCGHSNSYSTEEECERICGAFHGTNVCVARLDPGPCRASIPKFYWDAMSGSCQPYLYGGCAGGPNRFSTIEECMGICGDTGLDMPAAPLALPQQEPVVTASEGGMTTLRCLFHGNPPPKITWRVRELTIVGNASRYRLMSDGALEIISLYRNDTGDYTCVADNGLGVATQQIHLVVNVDSCIDPVTMPAGITGDENAVVTGELGQPLEVSCLAYGHPPPSVLWYRGYDGALVPYNDAVYRTSGNVLLIRSLAIETLGEYTCQAYNGEGKPASWVVFVRAYMPEGVFIENELLVPRNTSARDSRKQTSIKVGTTTTTTTTSTTTEAHKPLFTVPVSVYVSWSFSTTNVGVDLRLTCEVDGYPEPDVHWAKDGTKIQPDGARISINGSAIVSRLLVSRVTVADSGLYACHASNSYSSQSDTAQINVQQLTIRENCTDNPFFRHCDLIVRSKFCRHRYYGPFCCKSCVEAGQLDPEEVASLRANRS